MTKEYHHNVFVSTPNLKTSSLQNFVPLHFEIQKMLSIAIIGKGNVGFHLYHKLMKCDDLRVTQFNSREQHTVNDFDLAIIAVSDDVIAEVSLHIQCELVVHTSGNTALEVLQNSKGKGVFYPLQSFSKEKSVDFTKIPLCLEAETLEHFQVLESLAQKLGSPSFDIKSEQRKYIHAAAVFANNFTNHMYKMAFDICEEQQISFHILLPLIEETAEKMKKLSPTEAQTGPAQRKDEKTIKNHVNLLNDSQKEMYQILTESIQTHGKKL